MLQLTKKPTFKAKVDIPRPGEKSVPITAEYTYKTRTELEAWLKQAEGSEVKVVDAVREVLVGWEGVDTPFSSEALDQMAEVFPGSALALYEKYLHEQSRARSGN